MSDKLPTKAQFERSITDPAVLKQLLLQCFHHATSCLGGHDDVTDDRTKATLKILVQVWEAFPLELEALLVDIIWFASVATNGDERKTNALVTILSSLIAIPDRESFSRELLATLDPKLLQSCGLLPANEANVLVKKISKLNTELYYKQQKYNLLQEESEGYSKLLTRLFGDLTEITPQLLREYMGTFDLDPNRVLDLLIDLLESHDQKNKVITLMRDFSTAKLPPLLAFKLTSYRTSGMSLPPSLLRTIVLLAEEGLLDLTTLVPTALADVRACFAIYETLQKLQISRLGRISLTSDNSSRPDAKLQECQRSLQEGTEKLESDNALVGLLQVLLANRNWELASTLLPTPADWTQVCTLLPLKVGNELCNWVSAKIGTIYDTQVQTPKLKMFRLTNKSIQANGNGHGKQKNVEEVLESCYSALFSLGQSGCLATKPILYCKLCRLVRVMLLSHGTEKLKPTIYNLLKYVLVPTLSLLAPNPAIAADLWSLLSILPYPIRYQLYRDWRGGGLERAGMGSKPFLQIQCEMEAGKAARYSLKRLSKDNVRDMGRQVSKVTHSNPLVVFSTILGQIESYDNLIQMMVEAVRFVTPLSLDVLGYCVLTRLSGVGGVNRSRLKGTNCNGTRSIRDPFRSLCNVCPDS
jgi:THO complex subunit 2